MGSMTQQESTKNDFPVLMHHHATQAVLSLPFAHVAGVKVMPTA